MSCASGRFQQHAAPVAFALSLAACATTPPNTPTERGDSADLLLVSRIVNVGVEVSTSELQLHGDSAQLVERSQEWASGTWKPRYVMSSKGTVHPSLDGWIVELHNGDAPARRLSCVPVYRPVHPSGDEPIGLCTDGVRWTGKERSVRAWQCRDMDPNMVFFVFNDRLFAAPPGLERIVKACCPPKGDACDGWDGAWREIRSR